MKLSKILKYVGIVVGVLAAIRIIYALLALILTHWITLIVLGTGALVYFIGVWLGKQGK